MSGLKVSNFKIRLYFHVGNRIPSMIHNCCGSVVYRIRYVLSSFEHFEEDGTTSGSKLEKYQFAYAQYTINTINAVNTIQLTLYIQPSIVQYS